MLKYLATVFETKLGECETKFVSCILEWNHLIFHIKLNKEKIIFVFFFVICQVNIRFYIYSYPSSILFTNQESRLLFKRWLVWGGVNVVILFLIVFVRKCMQIFHRNSCTARQYFVQNILPVYSMRLHMQWLQSLFGFR